MDAVNSSTLANANTVNTVAAKVTGAGQGFVFTNFGDLEGGTAGGLTGIEAGAVGTRGAVALKSTTGHVVEAAIPTATVTADSLRLDAATSSTLTNDNSVNTLAAVIATLGDDFKFTNVGDFAIGSASGLTGIATSGGDIALAAKAGASAGSISEPVGATVTGASLALKTAGSALLGSDAQKNANHVATLAANIGGDLFYYDSGTLLISTANDTAAVAVDGITAGGKVWVRTAANLTTLKPVVGNGGGNQAVALAATNAFRNQAGIYGVRAPNGRWLIYDDNPTLEDRRGGLDFSFRRLHTCTAAIRRPVLRNKATATSPRP